MTPAQEAELLATLGRIATALEAKETRVNPLPQRRRRIPPGMENAVDELVKENIEALVKTTALKPKPPTP